MLESKLYALMKTKLAAKYETTEARVIMNSSKVLLSNGEMDNVNCPVVTYQQNYQVQYDVDEDGDVRAAKDQYFRFRKNKVYDTTAQHYRPEVDGDESYALVDDAMTDEILNFNSTNIAVDWSRSMGDVEEDQAELFRYWLREWSAAQTDTDLRVDGMLRVWPQIDPLFTDPYDKERYVGSQIVFAGRNVHQSITETLTRLYALDVIMIGTVATVLIRPHDETEAVWGRL